LCDAKGWEPTDDEAQKQYGIRFDIWVDKNPDLTSMEDRDAVRDEFERRQAAKEALEHAEASAAREARVQIAREEQDFFAEHLTEVGREDTPQRAAFDAWMREVAAPNGWTLSPAERDVTLASWLEDAGGLPAYRAKVAAQQADAGAKAQQLQVAAEEHRRLVAQQRQNYDTAIADPVYLLGDDPWALHGLAAFRLSEHVRLTITDDAVREQTEPAYTALLGKVRARTVEIAQAREQQAADRARRIAAGEPPAPLPAPIDLGQIVERNASGIARWLLAHRGQYELTQVGTWGWRWIGVTETDDGTPKPEPDFPAGWPTVMDRCRRWTAWHTLAPVIAAEPDATVAATMRDVAYAIVATSRTDGISPAIRDRAAALIKADLSNEWAERRWLPPEPTVEQVMAWEKAMRGDDDATVSEAKGGRPKKRGRPQTLEDVKLERAFEQTYKVLGAELVPPSGNTIATTIRKFGGAGKRDELIEGYRAYAAEQDALR